MYLYTMFQIIRITSITGHAFAQPIHTRPRPPTYVCYVYPNVRKHSQNLANTFTNIWNQNVAHNSTNIDTSKLQKP